MDDGRQTVDSDSKHRLAGVRAPPEPPVRGSRPRRGLAAAGAGEGAPRAAGSRFEVLEAEEAQEAEEVLRLTAEAWPRLKR